MLPLSLTPSDRRNPSMSQKSIPDQTPTPHPTCFPRRSFLYNFGLVFLLSFLGSAPAAPRSCSVGSVSLVSAFKLTGSPN